MNKFFLDIGGGWLVVLFSETKIGFSILDSVLAIQNNSGIANYSEMFIPTNHAASSFQTN